MGFFDFFRPNYQLAIGDCSSRTVSHTNSFPANLTGRTADGRTITYCRIHREGRDFYLEVLDPNYTVTLDGKTLDAEQEILLGHPYGVSLRGHLIVVQIGSKNSELDPSFLDGEWDIASKVDPDDRETLPQSELTADALAHRYLTTSDWMAFPMNGNACFTLDDLIAALPSDDLENSPAPVRSQPSPVQVKLPHALRPKNYGLDAAAAGKRDNQFACPCCWKFFSPGDAFNIASHDNLTGDPVLGPHAKLRFAAERFNELGQALDPEGVVSLDLACPHCRGRLPPSFLSQDHHILSLVGAPSSGKSYYLSVLLRLLPEEFIRHFGFNIQDGDPTGNAQLNEMKNRLFSATTPEDAFISKTDFEGVMYDRLHRNGKLVSLPRPFVYYAQRFDNSDDRVSLVFYDNAGEHFKPGITLDESPGALHVAASSGLLFLFDPTTNRNFRKQLARKRDPQLRSQATDEQDTILSELGVRIKIMQALESHQKVETPFAVIVGKFDVWRSLIPEDSIIIPEDRPLTAEEVAENSRVTRTVLARLCPTVVANAESISSKIMYFPVSSLGHSPRVLEEGPLAGKLAPLPRRLNPILVTTPVLWALGECLPELGCGPVGAEPAS